MSSAYGWLAGPSLVCVCVCMYVRVGGPDTKLKWCMHSCGLRESRTAFGICILCADSLSTSSLSEHFGKLTVSASTRKSA